MNEVMKNILTRVSVRDFTEKSVAKADVETMLEAALHAPSGMGKQTWNFVAVLNRELIIELADIMGRELGREGYNLYNATALIIPSNEPDSLWGRDDNACALQNIFLSAKSMGIGSVWINQLSGACDNKAIREMLTKLSVPENHVVYGMAALGYSENPFDGIKDKIGTFTIIE